MHRINKDHIFQFTRIQKIILALFKNNHELILKKLSKESNVTYSYLSLLINNLEEKGLVDKKYDGRIVKIKLTKKGIEFGELLKKCEVFLK